MAIEVGTGRGYDKLKDFIESGDLNGLNILLEKSTKDLTEMFGYLGKYFNGSFQNIAGITDFTVNFEDYIGLITQDESEQKSNLIEKLGDDIKDNFNGILERCREEKDKSNQSSESIFVVDNTAGSTTEKIFELVEGAESGKEAIEGLNSEIKEIGIGRDNLKSNIAGVISFAKDKIGNFFKSYDRLSEAEKGKLGFTNEKKENLSGDFDNKVVKISKLNKETKGKDLTQDIVDLFEGHENIDSVNLNYEDVEKLVSGLDSMINRLESSNSVVNEKTEGVVKILSREVILLAISEAMSKLNGGNISTDKMEKIVKDIIGDINNSGYNKVDYEKIRVALTNFVENKMVYLMGEVLDENVLDNAKKEEEELKKLSEKKGVDVDDVCEKMFANLGGNNLKINALNKGKDENKDEDEDEDIIDVELD